MGGTLPAGLSLSASTGVISGTPTAAYGPANITVQVSDSSSPQQVTTAVLSLTVTSSGASALVYSYAIPSFVPDSQPTGYDAVGNIVGYTDSVMGTWSMTTGTGASGYDTLSRLIEAQATAGPYQGLQVNWTIDAFGNRTAESFGGILAPGDTAPIPPSTSITPAASNRIQSEQIGTTNYTPSYDAAGDMTTDPSQGNTYLYDAEGRICAVSSLGVMTAYLYDAEGNRVAKGTITQ